MLYAICSNQLRPGFVHKTRYTSKVFFPQFLEIPMTNQFDALMYLIFDEPAAPVMSVRSWSFWKHIQPFGDMYTCIYIYTYTSEQQSNILWSSKGKTSKNNQSTIFDKLKPHRIDDRIPLTSHHSGYDHEASCLDNSHHIPIFNAWLSIQMCLKLMYPPNGSVISKFGGAICSDKCILRSLNHIPWYSPYIKRSKPII